jgi:AraC-like DNA-binding protein
MIARHETREYKTKAKVYIGHYINPINVPHWHYDWELILVKQGCLEIVIEGQPNLVYENQAIIIKGGLEHSLLPRSENEALVMIFPGELLGKTADEFKLKSYVLKKDYGLDRFFEEIEEELTKQAALYDVVVDCSVTRLFAEIFRSEEKNTEGEKEIRRPLMVLIDAIDKRYDSFSLKDGAGLLCMTETYFSKYFHKMSGIVFSKYLNSVRVEKAIAFLRSEPKPKASEVALKCGFGTIRNFNRVFKEMTGFSPSDLPSDYSFPATSILYAESSSFIKDNFNPTLSEAKLIQCWG